MERTQLVDLVITQIKEHLQQAQPLDQEVEELVIGEDTPLFGKDGLLDSLGLVAIVLNVEQVVNDTLNTDLVIADDRAMSQKSSPFATPGRLADYTMLLINERK